MEPEFPRGAQAFGVTGVLIVEVVIDRTGRVTSPHVLKPLAAPTLSYAALEAVKQWRFEPGRIGGESVPGICNLSVNYKIP